MKVEVLGGFGGESADCRITCLLFDDHTALDAGSLSRVLSVEQQAKVRRILLSHSHMDHISSLPFFIENVYGSREGSIPVHASATTIYAIRKYLFNNSTWPDFTRLPNHLLPAVQFEELADEVPIPIDGLSFTPIPVDHLVPTHGFLIDDGDSSLLWSSDTGPTTRLWEVANRTDNLRAVCIDVSFDNSLQRIADLSLHLTPQTLQRELDKLTRDVPVLLHHLKPPCVERIHEEIAALGDPRLGFLEQGRVYTF